MKISDSPFKVLRDPDAAVKFAEDQTKLLNKIRNDISSRAGVRESFTEQVKKKTEPLTELLAKQLPLLESAVTGSQPSDIETLRKLVLEQIAIPPELPEEYKKLIKPTKIANLLKKINEGQKLTRAELVTLQKLTSALSASPPAVKREPDEVARNAIATMIEKFQDINAGFSDKTIKQWMPIIDGEISSAFGEPDDPDFDEKSTRTARNFVTLALDRIVEIRDSKPNILTDMSPLKIIEEYIPELYFGGDNVGKLDIPAEEEPKQLPKTKEYKKILTAPKHNNVALQLPGGNIFISLEELNKGRLQQVSKSGEPINNEMLELIKLTPGLASLLSKARTKIRNQPSIDDIYQLQDIMKISDGIADHLYEYLKKGTSLRLISERIDDRPNIAKLTTNQYRDYTDYANALHDYGIDQNDILKHLINLGFSMEETNRIMTQIGKGLFTLGNPGHRRGKNVNRCGVVVRGGCQQMPPPMVYYQPQDVADRVGLLAGAIDAGNNAPQIKNELAILLDMMARRGWINHEQYGSAVKKYLKY